MAANREPVFTLTPVIGMVTISVANTARDGSGTLGTVLTGSLDGTRIHRITVQAIVATTLGMVRLFIGDNAGTPNIRLFKEIPVVALTPSASVGAFSYTLELLEERGLILPYNYTLRAAPHNAESFNVIAEGGSF